MSKKKGNINSTSKQAASHKIKDKIKYHVL
uniref:Uncharacterized protein n=1 Tax=virus sp. ctqq75 TaxID=2827999 RepID=A0A8S5RE24_9VIRU|nr:MAG TPA: hypothetical protein [virus sp. ctqq75]